MNNLIDRNQYPELDLMLWDNASPYIEKKEAFHIYERRFHFIDFNKISKQEKKLIQELADEFGNGVLLTR